MKSFRELLNQDLSLIEVEDVLDLLRRNQRYIYALIIIVFFSYFFFVKFQPNLKQYRKKSKTLREYRSVLKSRQKKTLNKENIEKEITRLKESLQEKESMFFSENDFSAFSINIVPKLAQAYENKIKSVVYDKKKAKKKELLSTYSIKVDFEGDFQGVLSFFDDLEYFSKVVKIQSFSMKRKSINPVVLSVKANLLAYGGGEP